MNAKVSIKKQNEVKALFEKGLKIVEIASFIKLDRHTVSKIINNRYKDRIRVNDYLFMDLNNRDLNYFLGLLATDGSICKDRIALALKESDLEIIEKFRNFLEDNVNIYKGSKTMNDKIFYYYKVAFRSRYIKEILNNYGITERKSLTLKLNIPITIDMLRGIIDGDGSYVIPTKGSCKINITSASIEFLDQIEEFLLQNNISCWRGVLTKGRKKTIYVLNITKQKDIINLIDFVYNNTDTFIKRKYLSATKMRNHLMKRLETQGTSVRNPEASQQLNEFIRRKKCDTYE